MHHDDDIICVEHLMEQFASCSAHDELGRCKILAQQLMGINFSFLTLVPARQQYDICCVVQSSSSR